MKEQSEESQKDTGLNMVSDFTHHNNFGPIANEDTPPKVVKPIRVIPGKRKAYNKEQQKSPSLA